MVSRLEVITEVVDFSVVSIGVWSVIDVLNCLLVSVCFRVVSIADRVLRDEVN